MIAFLMVIEDESLRNKLTDHKDKIEVPESLDKMKSI